VEYDRVNAGMVEFHTKMKAIADNKEQKTKRQKKIMKYAQAYLKIFLLCFRQRLIAKQTTYNYSQLLVPDYTTLLKYSMKPLNST